MRRIAIVTVCTIFLFQLCACALTSQDVSGEEFKPNVRVDRDVGAGPVRKNASVAVEDGNIYIVWEDSRNGGMDVYYSKSSNEGTSFLPDIRVNDNPIDDGTLQQYPDVSTHNGTVFVVWDDGRAGAGTHRIYFSKSTDGYSFTANIQVSDSGNSERYPSMAVDPVSGMIYVTWASLDREIRLARSIDGGESFEPSVLVSDSWINHRKWPDLAVGTAGKVFAVWSDGRSGDLPFPLGDDYDVYIANSTNYGQTFGTNVPVNEVLEDVIQSKASISVDGNDVVYVVWEDERLGTPRVFFAKSSDGSNFGPNVMVNDPFFHRKSPQITYHDASIAVNQSGDPILVVWTDNRGGNYNVYLAESNDGGNNFFTGTSRLGGNFFFDDNRSFNGLRNSEDAVLLDNGNGILDPGVLNGSDSPDMIVASGFANLWNDLEGQRIRFCDMNDNNMWDKDEDIVMDTPVIHYPRVKPMGTNPEDNTTGNLYTYLRWDLRTGDSRYYTVEQLERMVVGWFALKDARDEGLNDENTGLKVGDPISSVEIEFAYKTDSGYDGTSQVTWSLSLASEKPLFQVVDTDGVEVYERFDLFAQGLDTVEELQQLNISFVNDATSQYNVSFNSMFLAIGRGYADSYDIYDIQVYDGQVMSEQNKFLSNFSATDNLLFIDANATGFYERGEPFVATESHVAPGGTINKSFEVLPRGDGPSWTSVFEPFPLNDAVGSYVEESPVIAVDSKGHAYVVWRDGRNMGLYDTIYFATDADSLPPEVLDCFPQDGSVNLPLDTYISVLFSEPMRMETTTKVTLTPRTDWDWSWNIDMTNLTYNPIQLLEYNTTYLITINGAKDMSGNVLATPRYCQFRTTEAPVISHEPPYLPVMEEPIEILATISDNDSITDATFFYTNVGETNFSQTNMVLVAGSYVNGSWRAVIPAQLDMGYLSYYMVARDTFGNVGRYPASGEHDLMIVDGTPPSLTHSVIRTATAGSNLSFTATVTDNLEVFKVKLHIRPVGASHFNPPLMMERVGQTDEFTTNVTLPNKNGDMYYYIEVLDGWGNAAHSGIGMSPHKVAVTGAPLDMGAILFWAPLFFFIALIYLGMFIYFKAEKMKSEKEKSEPES